MNLLKTGTPIAEIDSLEAVREKLTKFVRTVWWSNIIANIAV